MGIEVSPDCASADADTTEKQAQIQSGSRQHPDESVPKQTGQTLPISAPLTPLTDEQIEDAMVRASIAGKTALAEHFFDMLTRRKHERAGNVISLNSKSTK